MYSCKKAKFNSRYFFSTGHLLILVFSYGVIHPTCTEVRDGTEVRTTASERTDNRFLEHLQDHLNRYSLPEDHSEGRWDFGSVCGATHQEGKFLSV